MQAALNAVEKKSKSALARTERLCEASMDSVRRGAAASLAMEARRLEGLLSGHAARFVEEASVSPLAKEEERYDQVGFKLIALTLLCLIDRAIRQQKAMIYMPVHGHVRCTPYRCMLCECFFHFRAGCKG